VNGYDLYLEIWVRYVIQSGDPAAAGLADEYKFGNDSVWI
jgi:hypothetical protein